MQKTLPILAMIVPKHREKPMEVSQGVICNNTLSVKCISNQGLYQIKHDTFKQRNVLHCTILSQHVDQW